MIRHSTWLTVFGPSCICSKF